MIALPPFEAGAVQLRAAELLPGEPKTELGEPGTVAAPAGVIGAEAVESAPVPTALTAATVNV